MPAPPVTEIHGDDTYSATYQVIDIDGGRLAYKAYDLQGNVLDEFTIEK